MTQGAARLGATCQSTHRDIFGERAICSCQLDSLPLPLVFRAILLLRVQTEVELQGAGAGPSVQHSQMPVIYSTFQDIITKEAQQMPWGP